MSLPSALTPPSSVSLFLPPRMICFRSLPISQTPSGIRSFVEITNLTSLQNFDSRAGAKLVLGYPYLGNVVRSETGTLIFYDEVIVAADDVKIVSIAAIERVDPQVTRSPPVQGIVATPANEVVPPFVAYQVVFIAVTLQLDRLRSSLGLEDFDVFVDPCVEIVIEILQRPYPPCHRRPIPRSCPRSRRRNRYSSLRHRAGYRRPRRHPACCRSIADNRVGKWLPARLRFSGPNGSRALNTSISMSLLSVKLISVRTYHILRPGPSMMISPSS